jgi:hypothetical protein
MSTLIEIEAAVDQLPYPEQEILLEHLACKLGMRPPVMEGFAEATRTWTANLYFAGRLAVSQPVAPEDSRRHRCGTLWMIAKDTGFLCAGLGNS